MAQPTAPVSSSLFEQDETAWLERMSSLIAQRRFDEVDGEHLAEYLSDMAKRDKREVLSRLIVLIAHLLKWKYQPERRSDSWRETMREQRRELEGMLDAVSLRRYAAEILEKAYDRAVKEAVDETALPKDRFPINCPMSLEQILGETGD